MSFAHHSRAHSWTQWDFFPEKGLLTPLKLRNMDDLTTVTLFHIQWLGAKYGQKEAWWYGKLRQMEGMGGPRNEGGRFKSGIWEVGQSGQESRGQTGCQLTNSRFTHSLTTLWQSDIHQWWWKHWSSWSVTITTVSCHGCEIIWRPAQLLWNRLISQFWPAVSFWLTRS